MPVKCQFIQEAMEYMLTSCNQKEIITPVRLAWEKKIDCNLASCVSWSLNRTAMPSFYLFREHLFSSMVVVYK